MSLPELRFTVLKDSGDRRGSSFPAAAAEWIRFLGKLEDAHISTLLPGCVRGNHYHAEKKELLIVLFTDEWQLAWDNGAATPVTTQVFSGTGAVTVEVDPFASHAVVNTGESPLWIIGLSSRLWDSESPDAHSRVVLPLPR